MCSTDSLPWRMGPSFVKVENVDMVGKKNKRLLKVLKQKNTLSHCLQIQCPFVHFERCLNRWSGPHPWMNFLSPWQVMLQSGHRPNEKKREPFSTTTCLFGKNMETIIKVQSVGFQTSNFCERRSSSEDLPPSNDLLGWVRKQ